MLYRACGKPHPNLKSRLRRPPTEISRDAIGAALGRRADLPVSAYLVEGNDRSLRAVERAGLSRVWRGADAGNPDAAAIRLLYSDRPLSAAQLTALTER